MSNSIPDADVVRFLRNEENASFVGEEARGGKKRVLFVYTNLGVGGIARSLIELLRVMEGLDLDITLYIRRDDVNELIGEIPSYVRLAVVRNSVKRVEFEDNLRGRAAERTYALLRKKHAFAAKRFFENYMRPIQRKREKDELDRLGLSWDTAICYSTDGDDPVFVRDCVRAAKKYVFIHQSTALAEENITAMRDFDGVFTVNPALIPWAEQMLPGGPPVRAIENYVDPEKVLRLSKEQTVGVPDQRILATSGRICLTKGYDFVIGAAKILKERGVRFLWYWIGDGPDRADMERRIEENGLGDEIVITGNLLNPFPYVAACEVYIQPSRAEAFSLSVLEAMILSRPVIATNTAGPAYLFEKYHCGAAVQTDAQSVADGILRLLENDEELEQERRALQSIDWAREREDYIRQWTELLRS